MAGMPGGLAQAKEADESIQTLIEQVRSDLESKAGKSFSQYKAVSYRSQIVAGTNFFVKVQVEEAEFVHVRVFRPLPGQGSGPELASYQLSKSSDDNLEYFG